MSEDITKLKTEVERLQASNDLLTRLRQENERLRLKVLQIEQGEKQKHDFDEEGFLEALVSDAVEGHKRSVERLNHFRKQKKNLLERQSQDPNEFINPPLQNT